MMPNYWLKAIQLRDRKAPPSNEENKLPYRILQVKDKAGRTRGQDWTDGCIAATDSAIEDNCRLNEQTNKFIERGLRQQEEKRCDTASMMTKENFRS